jgi:hypothetical protein
MKVWNYLLPSLYKNRYASYCRFDSKLVRRNLLKDGSMTSFASDPTAVLHRSKMCFLACYDFPVRG